MDMGKKGAGGCWVSLWYCYCCYPWANPSE